MAKKIDLMIVGAIKAGTTSLKNYLNEHPEILGHFQIDLTYFTNDSEYEAGYEKAFKKYFTEGGITKTRRVIAKDASVHQYEKTIKRLYEHNPECYIVFIIRNPDYLKVQEF